MKPKIVIFSLYQIEKKIQSETFYYKDSSRNISYHDGYKGYNWLKTDFAGIPRGIVIHKKEFKAMEALEVTVK